jgi:hypothetical protein
MELVRDHEVLTSTDRPPGGPLFGGGPDEQDPLVQLTDRAGEKAEAIRRLRELLFPASTGAFGAEWAKEWRRNRRVAHSEVFSTYLQRQRPQGVPPARVLRQLFESMSNYDEISSLLAGLDADLLAPAVERLEDWETEYSPDQVEPTSIALLNLLPDLKGQDVSEDFELALKIVRVVLRLFRVIEEAPRRSEIARNVLGELTSLSAKMELVEMLRHQEHAGHQLIPEEDARELEESLRREILDSPAGALAIERDLAKLLSWVLRTEAAATARVKNILADDAAWVGFLRSSISDVKTQTVGEVAFQRESRLPWDGWAQILGEDFLRQRVEQRGEPDSALDERGAKAVLLSKRYAEGWRPAD